MKHSLKSLLLSAALVTSSGQVNAEITDPALTMTGQEKIDYLISSLGAIKKRVEDGSTLTVGAVGYAELGGVIVDDAFNDGLITQEELDNYLEAKDLVTTHDYATATTAQQLFTQEYVAAMNDLDEALTVLTEASGEIMAAVNVMEQAATADTSPEQEALQGLLAQDDYSIDQAEVDAYNQAVAQVENYAQQAGAFMAAANNTELTASIDSYATQNNFLVGNYTAITYTQSVDEFVINWDTDGFGSGWQGYLSEDMKSASEIFDAGAYVAQYGTMPQPVQ